MWVLLCHARILFTMIKDTVGNFTGKKTTGLTAACARVDVCVSLCICIHGSQQAHEQQNFLWLSLRLKKKTCFSFFFIYLLRQEAGRMMKHLQCQRSPTSKNKNFLIKCIVTHTTLVFEAQYTTDVSRKRLCCIWCDFFCIGDYWMSAARFFFIPGYSGPPTLTLTRKINIWHILHLLILLSIICCCLVTWTAQWSGCWTC